MNRLGHATTPVTQKALQRQAASKETRLALLWGLLNLALAGLCFLEITFHSLADFFNLQPQFVWYPVCFLAVLFSINTVVDLARYALPIMQWTHQPIHLSLQERNLLGVNENAVGFKTSTPFRPRVASAPANLSSQGVASRSPSLQPSSTYLYQTTPTLGMPSMSFYNTPQGAGERSLVSPVFSTPQGSPYTTPQQSFSRVTPHGSPHTSMSGVSPSPLLRDGNSSMLLRNRHQSSPVTHSPLTSEEAITDPASLSSYLKTVEEMERKYQLGSNESSPSGSPSFWAYNRSAADYTPLLRKFQYQLASRSPQSPTSRKDDPDYPSTYRADEVWGRVGVRRDQLDHWIENLRKWISQTIMAPLAKAIDELNITLTKLGRAELQIGEVSLSSLRQVSLTKSQVVPTLSMVLPYLDVSANQEYVVQRIRELASGGCISDFRWDRGGDFKGRKWDEDLPSDCVMVMHMLCSYLDFQLPSDPKHPDGKTFTSQYFMKTPDKPDLKKKDNLLLFQTKINPPHYKVIIGDDTWDLPKGHSNMFQAILLMLHHVKTKEHGMLGRVNLGMSGINILWVIDDIERLPTVHQ
ncbi:transmembrane protein 209-like isoform X1 [Acanthaster planci]|uniref:Transmembrane protein 209-like isoform X1 n=1 Tax=Acanthaster planci TaxID=133434 RepID=A0A8B7XMJ7_ACAPL|nr:transmembrane protein 209-like isoform X1 [Acanthaster planci]XP_022081206.1 transmembrane protein 209-like isoform X2 [Acanthaster planci]XP_022081207.1 transmembrane protein 209-like isoform X1 [Acanthaster planci]